MREAEVPVTFQPSGKRAYVLRGTPLVEAAAGAGIALDLPCGGDGVCGKCRVLARPAPPAPGPREDEVFSGEELAQGWRLACQTPVDGPLTVEVPETSVLGSVAKILSHAQPAAPAAPDPPVRKSYVELPRPNRGSDQPDLARIQAAVGPVQAGLGLLRELPQRLRHAGFHGTVVSSEGALLDFERGDTTHQSYAVAFDLGTTTLVASLLDAQTGRELALATRLNPQTRFGDDVLSRIQHASESPHGLAELHETTVEAVDEMISEVAAETGVQPQQIYQLTFSGNTTMQQLLLRIDPKWLGRVPFVPATGDPVRTTAAKLGLRIHPRGRVYVMPVIGGFVGGDTVSGLLATGLAESEGPALLVDIGTNGEIVLAAAGRLLAASTAAGPAFEGARISQGMRGTPGAVEKVVVDGTLRINVIGDVPPVGLCGSALVDLAAELLRHRVVSPQGRLASPDELHADAPPDLVRRLVHHDGHPAFLLVDPTETDTGKPILVTQRDFRELQLATGAIRAGTEILLRRAGLATGHLSRVLVAGGFGNFIRRKNAQRIGLLPPGLPRSSIAYQGNTSLAGARLVAVSARARTWAETLAQRTEHVDLSADPQFHQAFAEAMTFPSPDYS